MAVSIFEDKSIMPDDSMVADALAGSYPLWISLRDFVNENYSNVKDEWKYYGKSSGWVLKLLSKNGRTLTTRSKLEPNFSL